MYPYILANRDGHADHGLAVLPFWAMSAASCGVAGFVPRNKVSRMPAFRDGRARWP
ncbi:cyd operon YbgE family protein [Cupriavidus basilensis]